MVNIIRFVISLFQTIIIINIVSCNVNEVPSFLEHYDNQRAKMRPGFPGPPVNVNISIVLRSISSISEVTEEYVVHFILRHFWNDPRLRFDERKANASRVTMFAWFINKLWVPDTFFRNSMDVKLNKNTGHERDILLAIHSNGDVLYSSRLIVTASCPMNLKFFPMDSQKCKLDMSSYAYSEEDVVYHWMTSRGVITQEQDRAELDNAEFEFVRAKLKNESMTGSTGNFSHLILDMYFSRHFGFYINQIYIPAVLIVSISWVNFWLEMDESHARVALTITTVLTMTTLISNTNDSLPKVSYVKAIDIYLFICFIMVFAALLASSITAYLASIHRKLNQNQCQHDTFLKLHGRKYGSRLDKVSRVAFPSLFTLFNLCYWLYYYVNHLKYDVDELVYS